MSFLTANNTFEKVDTFTQSTLAPKAIDTIFGSNVLIQILQGVTSEWAGKTMDYTVKYKKLNNGGSFSGLDRFNTNYVDTTKRMSFAPKNFEQPITIPKTDVNVGMTQEAVIPLITFAMEEAAMEAADSLGTMLYGDGTGNSSKDLLGLKAGAGDATISSTYGGLTRATYGLSGTVNATTYSSGGTPFTFTILNAHLKAVESGNQRVTVMLCTEAVFSVIEALFATPTQNTNLFPASNSITSQAQVAALGVNQGYRDLKYKGIPIVPDEQCPAKHLFTLNLKTWTFPVMKSMIDTTPIKVASTTIEGQYSENLERPIMFHIGDWITPDDQYAMINHIYLTGNLICKNPRFNGFFSDIS